MTLLDRAIESAQARLEMHKTNLVRSEGNEQTIAKRKNQVEVSEFMLNALLEKVEREKGCEYCTTGESLNGYDDVGSFAIHPMGKKHYLGVAYDDYFYNCDVHINFCPICGKRLEEKHDKD